MAAPRKYLTGRAGLDLVKASSVFLLTVTSLYMMAGPNAFFSTSVNGRVVTEASSGSVLQYIFIALSFFPMLYIVAKVNLSLLNYIGYALIGVASLCVISALWSDVPLISIRRSAMLIYTLICVFSAAYVLGPTRVMWISFWVGCFLLAVSYAYVSVGIGVHDFVDGADVLIGNWKGIYPHKNTAGSFCASFAILSFVLFVKERKLITAVLLFVSLVFLYYTASKTPLIATILSVSVGLIAVYFFKNKRAIVYIYSAATVTIIGFVLFKIFTISSQADADTLLTGRGQIWREVWPLVSERSFFGFGYGSFWGLGFENKVISQTDSFVRYLNQAHNGYLDVVISIGVPGIVLSIYAFFIRPAFLSLRSEIHNYCLMISVLIFNVIANITESVLLAPDFPGWYVLMIAIAANSNSKIPRKLARNRRALK